jgi:hypothetical protein
MDSAEFTRWQAMFLIAPFGDDVADRRHGDAMAVQFNAHFGSRDKQFTASDFMLGGSDLLQSLPEDEPEFIEDPVALSNLIRAAVFGIAPKQPM